MGEAVGVSDSRGLRATTLTQPSMRMLALVADAFGGPGGIAEYDRHLLSSLAACRWTEQLIVLPRQGVSGVALPPRMQQLPSVEGKLAYSLAVIKAACARRPIHLVFCGHLYMAPLAAAVAKFARAQLWIQVHGLEAWHELSALHRRSVEMAALVTAVSRDTRRRLLQWVDIDPARVKVLSDTFNPRFQPGPKSVALLDRYNLHGKKVLMTVSRLSAKERYKGHDRVIQALPGILADHPDTIYVVIGDGDDRARLELLAGNLAIADKVRFLGYISAEDMPDHFRLADVFVMPSTCEGFGIVFLEAMASGIDVIAGNRDGSLDAVCDGLVGRAVDPDSREELTTAISDSLNHPCKDANRAQRFRRELFAQHLEQLLKSTLCARRERNAYAKHYN